MTESEILSQLQSLRIVPVIVINDPADAEPLGAALAEGGLPCAEITFRTAAAGEAIRRIADAHPDLLVGAGTVLSPKQAAEAKAAGAKLRRQPGLQPGAWWTPARSRGSRSSRASARRRRSRRRWRRS